MKIRNTGYNTTIKPNTQYTVVFDTDKNGEVGIELGGAKVTTSNNVATTTTPATLSDSDLRLYCKGIKSSKVRLLEGNKSSCIPGYFEGLQSCFEDKLQDDGTYKIEITSRNKDITKQSNIQLSSIEPLRGVGNVKDRFIFRDDKLVIERRLEERDYQDGDEYLNNTLTDKIKTVYVLDKPYYEEVPSKLQRLVFKCYEDGSLFFDTSVPPTSTVAYSVDMPVINKLNSLDDMSTNLVSTTWDMDYRLFELEWMLYECMPVSVNLEEMFNVRRSGTMALSRFEQAKIMILGGAYSDATLRKQLGTYLSRGIITQEEYDELMSMMDARLLVEGN